MTLDDYFREQISRGQPPMVALHNAAQAYADSLRRRPDCTCPTLDGVQVIGSSCPLHGLPVDHEYLRGKSIGDHNEVAEDRDSLERRDCSQYADETEAWGEQQDNDEVEIQRRLRTFLHKANPGGCRVFSLGEQCQCPLCDLDRLLSAMSKPQDSEAVELLREGDRLMASRTTWTSAEMLWHDRVRNFLEGK